MRKKNVPLNTCKRLFISTLWTIELMLFRPHTKTISLIICWKLHPPSARTTNAQKTSEISSIRKFHRPEMSVHRAISQLLSPLTCFGCGVGERNLIRIYAPTCSSIRTQWNKNLQLHMYTMIQESTAIAPEMMLQVKRDFISLVYGEWSSLYWRDCLWLTGADKGSHYQEDDDG